MLELLEMEESASSHSASSSVCSSAPIVGFLRVCLEDFVGCDFFATVFGVVFFAVGFLDFFDFGSASSSDSTWEPLNIYLNKNNIISFLIYRIVLDLEAFLALVFFLFDVSLTCSFSRFKSLKSLTLTSTQLVILNLSLIIIGTK